MHPSVLVITSPAVSLNVHDLRAVTCKLVEHVAIIKLTIFETVVSLRRRTTGVDEAHEVKATRLVKV